MSQSAVTDDILESRTLKLREAINLGCCHRFFLSWCRCFRSVPAALGGVTVIDTWVFVTLQATIHRPMAQGCGYKCQGATWRAFLSLVVCDWKDFPSRFWVVRSKTNLYCFPSWWRTLPPTFLAKSCCPCLFCLFFFSLVSPWFIF